MKRETGLRTHGDFQKHRTKKLETEDQPLTFRPPGATEQDAKIPIPERHRNTIWTPPDSYISPGPTVPFTQGASTLQALCSVP